MFNNMMKKIKKFIKEEYLFIIIVFVLLIVSLFPLPFYIISGGGTSVIDDKIKIAYEYKSIGSFSFTYVKEMKGTPMTYLLSKIYNYEIIPQADLVDEEEDLEDYENRNKVYLDESISNATYVAYSYANKYIKTLKKVYTVMYISNHAKTNLKTGDIILKMDGITINDLSNYKLALSKKNVGDIVNITVNRNNKEIACNAKIIELDNEKVLGIYLTTEEVYDTNPNIKFNFSKKESGSSGGLMLALSIYDKLTKIDITKGLNISGTGSIDNLGNVYPIEGVEYKLKGAVKDKKDVFIVPSGDNYQKALNIKKKKNYDITIIEAKTFDQVLKELAKL